MSLLDLWQSSPSQIRGKQVDQIIAFAGSGRLLDGESTSGEFRELLQEIEDDLLISFAADCLTKKFENSGLALQDIVNQIGVRLGFQVKTGRYRGTPGQIGNDGLWLAPNHSIVVEVKTTDAYRSRSRRVWTTPILRTGSGACSFRMSSRVWTPSSM